MIKHIWLQVMWFVVLNANFFHFYHFHPYPSPGTVKYYHLKKRRKIALCGRITLFCLHMTPYGVIFGIIEQKSEKWQIRIDGSKIGYVARHVLHISHFLINNHLLHYSKHYLHMIVNLIYSTIHIIPNILSHNTVIFNTIISILQYCYHIVTLL